MEAVATPSVHVCEGGVWLVPADGENVFEQLALAKPEGFISITVYPDNRAYMLLHQEAPIEGIPVEVVGGI